MVEDLQKEKQKIPHKPNLRSIYQNQLFSRHDVGILFAQFRHAQPYPLSILRAKEQRRKDIKKPSFP